MFVHNCDDLSFDRVYLRIAHSKKITEAMPDTALIKALRKVVIQC